MIGNTTCDKIVKSLLAQGFVIKSMNRHVKMVSPEGHMVTVGTSLSKGCRSIQNLEATIRRAGYHLVAPKRGARGSRGGRL